MSRQTGNEDFIFPCPWLKEDSPALYAGCFEWPDKKKQREGEVVFVEEYDG